MYSSTFSRIQRLFYILFALSFIYSQDAWAPPKEGDGKKVTGIKRGRTSPEKGSNGNDTEPDTSEKENPAKRAKKSGQDSDVDMASARPDEAFPEQLQSQASTPSDSIDHQLSLMHTEDMREKEPTQKPPSPSGKDEKPNSSSSSAGHSQSEGGSASQVYHRYTHSHAQGKGEIRSLYICNDAVLICKGLPHPLRLLDPSDEELFAFMRRSRSFLFNGNHLFVKLQITYHSNKGAMGSISSLLCWDKSKRQFSVDTEYQPHLTQSHPNKDLRVVDFCTDADLMQIPPQDRDSFWIVNLSKEMARDQSTSFLEGYTLEKTNPGTDRDKKPRERGYHSEPQVLNLLGKDENGYLFRNLAEKIPLDCSIGAFFIKFISSSDACVNCQGAIHCSRKPLKDVICRSLVGKFKEPFPLVFVYAANDFWPDNSVSYNKCGYVCSTDAPTCIPQEIIWKHPFSITGFRPLPKFVFTASEVEEDPPHMFTLLENPIIRHYLERIFQKPIFNALEPDKKEWSVILIRQYVGKA